MIMVPDNRYEPLEDQIVLRAISKYEGQLGHNINQPPKTSTAMKRGKILIACYRVMVLPVAADTRPGFKIIGSPQDGLE